MNRVSCVVFAVVMLISALSYAQKVDVGGLVQARYTDQQCEDADFTVKAARVKLSMKVTDQITVVSQFDVAKEPNLLDAMIDYELSRLVTFRVGQFSLPFGFETQVSRYYLEAMDRSLVISHLWNNGVSSPYIRDVGAMIMGRFKILEYRIAAVDGVGYNYVAPEAPPPGNIFPKWGTDNNNTKDIVGRIGMGVPMFAGLGFSFYEGKWAEGEDKKATAFDMYFDTGKIIFQLEHVRATGRLDGSDWKTNDHSGYYIVVGYRVTPLIEPVFKLDKYDPSRGTEDDRMRDLYFGVNLNFERKARLQVVYRKSKKAPTDLDDDALLMQMSARF